MCWPARWALGELPAAGEGGGDRAALESSVGRLTRQIEAVRADIAAQE